MISNAEELETAIRQLGTLEDMLEATRQHLNDVAPALFPTVSESYLKKINSLRDDIITYLREKPAESPLTVS
jgi:hypothetical protein